MHQTGFSGFTHTQTWCVFCLFNTSNMSYYKLIRESDLIQFLWYFVKKITGFADFKQLFVLIKFYFVSYFREYLATFKKTVAMHEVFLQRIAAHPALRNDVNFEVFLEYDQDVCNI